MHHALLLATTAIARAHDPWREGVGRRRALSGKIAVLEERVARLEAESALLDVVLHTERSAARAAPGRVLSPST